MTIKDLEQLAARKREIGDLIERIERARSSGLYRSPGQIRISNGMPPGSTDFGLAAVEAFEQILRDRLLNLVIAVLRTEAWLSQLSDSKMRQMIDFRYLRGWGWLKIAFTLGYHDEQVPRRQVTRYLAKYARESRKTA